MAHDPGATPPRPRAEGGPAPKAPKAPKPAAQPAAGDRQQRRAATLRENLRRRKLQQRLRAAAPGAEEA